MWHVWCRFVLFPLCKPTFLHLFPVKDVVALGNLNQFVQSVRLAKYGDFIFQAVGEAVVELKAEGSISPSNLSSKGVESY